MLQIAPQNPADDLCYDCTNAGNVIANSMVEAATLDCFKSVECDNECLDAVDGEEVEFTIPSIRVKVRRSRNVDSVAEEVLIEAAEFLLAAARSAKDEARKMGL